MMYEWISKHLIFVGCLDILTTAHQMGLTFFEEEKDKQASTKVYAKEDFFVLNRFEISDLNHYSLKCCLFHRQSSQCWYPKLSYKHSNHFILTDEM